MSRYVLLDIGGTSIKTALFDKEMGEVKEYPTDAKKGADKLIEKVIEIINTYEGFEAIGISTAGQVDFEGGSIIYANENMPGYTGTKWREILSSMCRYMLKMTSTQRLWARAIKELPEM